MTVITKASLADEMRVSRARVSQYVKAGLPVRSDGKLNRYEALNWLKRNAVGLYSGDDKGVNRAGRLVKAVKPAPRAPEPAPESESDTIPDADPWVVAAELVGQGGAIAAEIAVEAGASMQVAYALDQAVNLRLWNLAETLLGIPAGTRSDFEPMVNARIRELDWPVLADQAAEPVDEETWSAFADSLPSLKPSRP